MVPALLRDVRRRRGLSVRGAAAACDVPRSTWADWESGRSCPSAQRLDEVLAVLAYDLRLVDRATEPPGEESVRRHLAMSLTERARRALGEQLDAVLAACRERPRVLSGAAAAGIWVPHVVARGPLPLPPAGAADGRVRLVLRATDGRRTAPGFVHTPEVLLSQGAGDTWPGLLTAARLLHEERPRDRAQRRLPPHRDPDESREAHDISHTLRWGGRGPVPVSPADSRGWRLHAPASLDEALLRQRFPARHDARLRGSRP